jgi:hypothetical protein
MMLALPLLCAVPSLITALVILTPWLRARVLKKK